MAIQRRRRQLAGCMQMPGYLTFYCRDGSLLALFSRAISDSLRCAAPHIRPRHARRGK